MKLDKNILGYIGRCCDTAQVFPVVLLSDLKRKFGKQEAIDLLQRLLNEEIVQPAIMTEHYDEFLKYTPDITIDYLVRNGYIFTLTSTGNRRIVNACPKFHPDGMYTPNKRKGSFILYRSSIKATPDNSDESIHSDEEIIKVSSFINDALLKQLKYNPDKMLIMSARQFEEVIAELFYREGFEVTLTRPSSDGGRDLLAVSNTSFGTHLYLVECKHYDIHRPVGVEYVRSLYGVVANEKATSGILCTTSYFTKGAIAFSRDVRWRMHLKDLDDIKKWLSRVDLSK